MNEPDTSGGHLSAEEFRRHGHRVIDWIADYWQGVADRPVLSPARPGQIADRLPAAVPSDPEPFEQIMADLDSVILPGITHWQHPRFFAYFPANSSPAAVLGDLISSGIGSQGMLWATSPAATELEQTVLDALAEALGLPEQFRHDADGPGGGVISDTASTATFTAVLAALHRASGGDARRNGVRPGHHVVYGSEQAHSSLHKAVLMAGLGETSLRTIGVDPVTQAMDVHALRAAVRQDVAAGRVPVLIQAAAGTTSTGAFDDVAAIGTIAREHGAWLHVDAAWAGVAAVCPELRWVNAGVAEFADSYVTNPHKWLLTTFDCSTFWVRDRTALIGALTILPEYLRNAATESGAVVDFRDWHPQLGRRFRAVKLWTVLRSYGHSGLRAHIRSGIELAGRFGELVGSDARLVIVTDPVLSLLVFRVAANQDGAPPDDAAADRATTAVMDAVNASGTAYLSHTVVNGRIALRLAVGAWQSTAEDIDRTWRALQEALDAVVTPRLS